VLTNHLKYTWAELTAVRSDNNAMHSVYPSANSKDEIVERIRKLVPENKAITICDLDNKVGIPFGQCQSVLTQAELYQYKP
jgi:ribosomal protein S25